MGLGPLCQAVISFGVILNRYTRRASGAVIAAASCRFCRVAGDRHKVGQNSLDCRTMIIAVQPALGQVNAASFGSSYALPAVSIRSVFLEVTSYGSACCLLAGRSVRQKQGHQSRDRDLLQHLDRIVVCCSVTFLKHFLLESRISNTIQERYCHDARGIQARQTGNSRLGNRLDRTDR